jgi:hypothetical protein
MTAPAVAWECPCGRERNANWTLISLREPRCRYCGRAYKDEYRVTADRVSALVGGTAEETSV